MMGANTDPWGTPLNISPQLEVSVSACGLSSERNETEREAFCNDLDEF